jgi:hypothetical protein
MQGNAAAVTSTQKRAAVRVFGLVMKSYTLREPFSRGEAPDFARAERVVA